MLLPQPTRLCTSLSKRLHPRRLNRDIRCRRCTHTDPAPAPVPEKAPVIFKLLFFGRDEFSCRVYQELVRTAGPDVIESVQVVTYPDQKSGRNGSQLSVSPLKTLLANTSTPIHEIPPTKSAFRTWNPPAPFAAPEPTNLLVTASFGRILPSPLLRLFAPARRLNVHPSLLPRFRGPAPLQRALLAGAGVNSGGGNSDGARERETGVCVIGMTEVRRGVPRAERGIDAGEVWARERWPIEEETTFAQLRDALGTAGGRLLAGVLRDMIAGTAVPTPQLPLASSHDHEYEYEYAPLITAADARVDWTCMSAAHAVRVHRAIGHQRPLWTLLPDDATAVQLHEPRVLVPDASALPDLPAPGACTYHAASDSVLVRCAPNSELDGGGAEGEGTPTLLSVRALKTQDRTLLAAKQWWNGVRPEWVVGRGKRRVMQFGGFGEGGVGGVGAKLD